MFGRAGRDGQSSTCVLLYRQRSISGKGVDPAVASLVTRKTCIRQQFCSLLESPYDKSSQGQSPCCYHCHVSGEDPNSLFLFGDKRTTTKSKAIDKSPRKAEVSQSARRRLQRKLESWRTRVAQSHTMCFLGDEGVASNTLLQKIVDVSPNLKSLADVERVTGVQKRFALSLFEAISYPEDCIEHDHCYF